MENQKSIRYLKEKTHKKLHHDKEIWPSYVELSLWSYVLQKYNHAHNRLPDKEYVTSPIDRFTGSPIAPKISDNHAFG